jgi:hypothetical protein
MGEFLPGDGRARRVFPYLLSVLVLFFLGLLLYSQITRLDTDPTPGQIVAYGVVDLVYGGIYAGIGTIVPRHLASVFRHQGERILPAVRRMRLLAWTLAVMYVARAVPNFVVTEHWHGEPLGFLFVA